MRNLLIISLAILVCAVHTRPKKPFDLRGFLRRVVESNMKKSLIGEVKIGCDQYDWCSHYKNYCDHPTIKTYCKGTCNICPTQPPSPTEKICKDKRNCERIKKYCTDNRYQKYMHEYCSATCGVCGEQLACGVAERRSNKVSDPIVGGEDAKKGYYPWQVAIYYENTFLCGGSLIDNRHVLTAAHCFKYLSTDLTLYKIVLGEHNRASNEGTEEERAVSRITQHRDYQYESDTHDVAIMKMDKEVVFGADINAICLAENNENLPIGRKCFMSGWGKLHNAGTSVDRLQHVALPIVGLEHCQERNTFNNHVVNDRMICAGYNDGLTYASGCHGDSGGPLACEETDGRWKLYGVTSWGSPQCNGLDRYTVFSRVSMYTDWINSETS